MNVRIKKSIPVNFQALASPPAGDFIHGGATYRDVYRLAAGLYRELMDGHDRSPFCICSEDKVLILASIIASYFSGIPAVLPYAFSPQVISDAKEAIGFRRIIAKDGISPIRGVDIITPVYSEQGMQEMVGQPAESEAVFLYLFTGGSTGTPRVWAKTPRNIFAEAAYQAGLFAFSRGDVVLSTVPPYHIYGLLFSIIIPLISGASVLNDVLTFPQEIYSSIRSGVATVFVSVPMHYHVLEGSDVKGHRLRMAFSSAGALEEGDAENFFRMTGIGVREVYGSTETGGIAWRCRAGGDEYLRPFEAVSWKITGERLGVRSDFISPELPCDGDGYFLTGDRAVARDDGTIQLLGRSDGVVKIGGKRVDLGEVQNKMKKIPGVTDAYLLPLKGRAGRGNEVVALIQGTIDEAEVRRLAAANLEPYAVPRRIKVIDKIPVLSTGKYDRKAIEALFVAGKK